jgi:hypothetical protein
MKSTDHHSSLRIKVSRITTIQKNGSIHNYGATKNPFNFKN